MLEVEDDVAERILSATMPPPKKSPRKNKKTVKESLQPPWTRKVPKERPKSTQARNEKRRLDKHKKRRAYSKDSER